MCITAYSSTYLKMTSEEMSTENSELVIKSGWTGYSLEAFNERLLDYYTMQDFLAHACIS